jgi:hypothetical protein
LVQRTSLFLAIILTSSALSLGQVSIATSSSIATPGQSSSTANNPVLQAISELSLDNQTVFDGLAKLNGMTQLGFSVERELTSREVPALAPLLRLNGKIEAVTLREALDWLCKLDPRYSWSTDGRMINFYPKSIENDPNYPLNKKVAPFDLHDVTSATAAVGAATGHTYPRQQLAVLQLGSDEFKVPANLSFKAMTLRQALNVIAEAMGQSHGWQFTGTKDFRCMVFHEHLLLQRRQIGGPGSEEP